MAVVFSFLEHDALVLTAVIVVFFTPQIQNADDVLISPLERFRKEQIGAVKVRLHLSH